VQAVDGPFLEAPDGGRVDPEFPGEFLPRDFKAPEIHAPNAAVFLGLQGFLQNAPQPVEEQLLSGLPGLDSELFHLVFAPRGRFEADIVQSGWVDNGCPAVAAAHVVCFL